MPPPQKKTALLESLLAHPGSFGSMKHNSNVPNLQKGPARNLATNVVSFINLLRAAAAEAT